MNIIMLKIMENIFVLVFIIEIMLVKFDVG